MPKLIIFDLDGVLADTVQYHYLALNEALPDEFKITEEERHLYEGKTTNEKLDLLTEKKGLRTGLHRSIKLYKQKYYNKYLDNIEKNENIHDIIKYFYEEDFIIGVCTNSQRIAAEKALDKIELKQYFNFIFTSEDITNPKPAPDIYLKAMKFAYVKPWNTYIVEDSDQGLEAAVKSGAHTIKAEYKTITLENILSKI